MDTNNNTNPAETNMENPSPTQIKIKQEDEQLEQINENSINNDIQSTLDTHQANDQQAQSISPNIANENQIELHAKYDATDTLATDSAPQTPIEDEPSSQDEQLVIDQHNTSEKPNAETESSDNASEAKTTAKHGVICVKESESNEAESIEIELESDNSLLLTSLTSLFPGTTGLKYRHPATNTLRGVKLADGKFVQPIDGWSSVSNYICVFNRGAKRKANNEEDSIKGKQAKNEADGDNGSDLVVLGLPWTTSEATMKTYFEQYGEVVMVQVKTDPKTGKSRGFGFVRFAKSNVQKKLMSMRHLIDGRWCDVRVPLSKAEADASKAAQLSRKIFVGRLPDNITTDDLRDHFSTFGTLTDVFIPKPFRNFAFVTFGTSDMAQSIFKHKHVINGSTVQISEAIPRDNVPNNHGGYSGSPANNTSSGYGSAYGSVNNNNINPFNSSYTHQAAPQYHAGKAPVSNLYSTGWKPQHQQQSYYPMTSYSNLGPNSSGNPANSYSQTSAGLNGGQYYKLPQHQVVSQPHPNHNSTYPPQLSSSSYSAHSTNYGRYKF